MFLFTNCHFKVLNSSPCFAVGRHFLYHFYFHHELDSFRGCKFLRVADIRALSIDRISRAGNCRGGEYTCWPISLKCPPSVVARCNSYRYGPEVQSQTIYFFLCSCSIKSWLFPEVKSTFCGTHVLPGTNVFERFFFYFLF